MNKSDWLFFVSNSLNLKSILKPSSPGECAAGRYYDSVKCVKCDIGQYSEAGSTNCKTCTSGQESNEELSTCGNNFCESFMYKNTLEPRRELQKHC